MTMNYSIFLPNAPHDPGPEEDVRGMNTCPVCRKTVSVRHFGGSAKCDEHGVIWPEYPDRDTGPEYEDD